MKVIATKRLKGLDILDMKQNVHSMTISGKYFFSGNNKTIF